ncbi:hypothetical protein AMTRI_Chr02g254160 [Amborella trichopoda]
MASIIHSCKTSAETLEWAKAIAQFLRAYQCLLNAHVVNFFRDKLWETLDQQWLDCLREEPVRNLLSIPSGTVQDNWPGSLKEFINTARSLSFPKEGESLEMIFPGVRVEPVSNVLAQGMNLKKKHEVEILAATVGRVASSVGAHTIIDVGAGQGYLAQVLSFQYQLSVYALDASAHHASVTSERAERIKKYYTTKSRKTIAGNEHFMIPKTITCNISSSGALTALSDMSLLKNSIKESQESSKLLGALSIEDLESKEEKVSRPLSFDGKSVKSSLVLAGLHACGDLSANMLRTFVESDDMKALISIGCCYNLLSDDCSESVASQYGCPMSNGVKSVGLKLGRNARDLACQSAERWRSLRDDAALQNFDLHAFRAAFQMIVHDYYPELVDMNPSIGRQGKALRRRQLRKALHSELIAKDNSAFPSPSFNKISESFESSKAFVAGEVRTSELPNLSEMEGNIDRYEGKNRVDTYVFRLANLDCQSTDRISKSGERKERTLSYRSFEKSALFEEFSRSGLDRLGIGPKDDIDFLCVWEKAVPYAELIGPYWSLRALMGPLVETFLLLDRLLFLQEQGRSSIQAIMLPLFDPVLSPRNTAIIAWKVAQ